MRFVIGSVYQNRGTEVDQKCGKRYSRCQAERGTSSCRGRSVGGWRMQSFGRRSASGDDAYKSHRSDSWSWKVFSVPAMSCADWRLEVWICFTYLLESIHLVSTVSFSEDCLQFGNLTPRLGQARSFFAVTVTCKLCDVYFQLRHSVGTVDQCHGPSSWTVCRVVWHRTVLAFF